MEQEEIKEEFKVTERDRLYLRVSKSGEGLYATNGEIAFGLRGNRNHLIAVLKEEKDFCVLEVVGKTPQA